MKFCREGPHSTHLIGMSIPFSSRWIVVLPSEEVGGSHRADGGVRSGDVCGIGNGVSPGKVAEALRYLARRVGDAEKGKEAVARERGTSTRISPDFCVM